MKYFQYFFVAAFVFLTGWIIVVGGFDLVNITVSSNATLIAFAFGGFCSPFICFLLAIWINKLIVNHNKNKHLDMKNYYLTDRAIDSYVDRVSNAHTTEELDRIERRFRSAL